jgi:hypothetical protein
MDTRERNSCAFPYKRNWRKSFYSVQQMILNRSLNLCDGGINSLFFGKIGYVTLHVYWNIAKGAQSRVSRPDDSHKLRPNVDDDSMSRAQSRLGVSGNSFRREKLGVLSIHVSKPRIESCNSASRTCTSSTLFSCNKV